MGQKGNMQARPIEFDTVKIVKIEEVRQMWTTSGQSQRMTTLLDQILGVVFNCLCISICCLIFVSLVFSSVKLLLCVAGAAAIIYLILSTQIELEQAPTQ